jgi:hypothetical protein
MLYELVFALEKTIDLKKVRVKGNISQTLERIIV